MYNYILWVEVVLLKKIVWLLESRNKFLNKLNILLLGWWIDVIIVFLFWDKFFKVVIMKYVEVLYGFYLFNIVINIVKDCVFLFVNYVWLILKIEDVLIVNGFLFVKFIGGFI